MFLYGFYGYIFSYGLKIRDLEIADGYQLVIIMVISGSVVFYGTMYSSHAYCS